MAQKVLHDQTKRKAADDRRHADFIAKQKAKFEALKVLFTGRVPEPAALTASKEPLTERRTKTEKA